MGEIADETELLLSIGGCMVLLRDGACWLYSHETPCLVQLEHLGCVSSHLTRRTLHCLQPLRDFL